MKVNNPFLLGIIFLQLLATIYFWKKGQIALSCCQFFVALANCALMQIK